MEGLDRLRRAAAQHAGKSLGLRADIPRYLIAHQRAVRREGDILAMPVALVTAGASGATAGIPASVRDWDPASATFGEHLFLLDYDAIGANPLA